MKCRYTFPVKGRFLRFPVNGFNFKAKDRFYEFIEAKESQYELSITVFNFPLTSLPTISTNTDGEIAATISVPDDPFWDDILAEVWTIEGALCLWGVDEIVTDDGSTEWIPENDLEREKMQMFSLSKKRDRSPPENLPFCSIDLFVRSIMASSELRGQETPLNFFRRGREDVFEDRYIEAIYDLYFVLEFLFADGKFKKNDVIEKFMQSNELLKAIQETQVTSDPQIMANATLSNEFIIKYKSRSHEEIIQHIVQLRGYLHHYNIKRKDIWHPSKQREFKVDALVLLQICHKIMSSRAIAVLFDNKNVREFLATEVMTEDGRKIQWKADQN